MNRSEYNQYLTRSGAYPKHKTIEYWKNLPENLSVTDEFVPILHKASGSSYGACGIRIDGTPAFIDAVMSRLKDVLDLECSDTRLELARSKVKATVINGKTKTYDKAPLDAEVCYIRLHERGDEAKMVNGFLDAVLNR